MKILGGCAPDGRGGRGRYSYEGWVHGGQVVYGARNNNYYPMRAIQRAQRERERDNALLFIRTNHV